MEATLGFEPRNESFAGSCLTTWPCRRFIFYSHLSGANGENRTHTPKPEQDFKSCASTYSATLAYPKINGAGDGIRTRGPNLGKVVLYP